MVGITQSHNTIIHLEKTAHTELESGAEVTLIVRVKCPDFCDLRESIVRITGQTAEVQEIVLTEYNKVENGAPAFVVKVPDLAGTYTWTAEFPTQEKNGRKHQGSKTEYSFTFQPHAISISVWDIASPVVANEAFKLKIGVKCSANCSLVGKEIEITNHEGAKVGRATLSDAPWPASSSALYWAEVEMQAPDEEGSYKWQVTFPEPDLELPHEKATHSFGFRVMKAPEHAVTVVVIDKDTQDPVSDAQVILHPYKGTTNEYGVTKVEIPKGSYNLYVSKKNYTTYRTTVIVASDIMINTELSQPAKLLEDS